MIYVTNKPTRQSSILTKPMNQVHAQTFVTEKRATKYCLSDKIILCVIMYIGLWLCCFCLNQIYGHDRVRLVFLRLVQFSVQFTPTLACLKWNRITNLFNLIERLYYCLVLFGFFAVSCGSCNVLLILLFCLVCFWPSFMLLFNLLLWISALLYKPLKFYEHFNAFRMNRTCICLKLLV